MEDRMANKTRLVDIPIVRMAIQKWQELYGQQSEVALNLLTAILVIVFISYQAHQLLTRDNRLSRLRQNAQIRRQEICDKSVGDEEHLLDLHEHYLHVGQVVHKCNSPTDEEALRSSQYFYERMKCRRSQRVFSERPVPIKVLTNLVKTAGTSPSAGHCQPWMFCIVMREDLRFQIRDVIEQEYCESYRRKTGEVDDSIVGLVQGSWNRAYVSDAPALIVVCGSVNGVKEQRMPRLNEVGCSIAVGLLMAAIQHVGLATVATWPGGAAPTIGKILRRPADETVLLLLPLGYPPGEEVTFPDLNRKPIENIIRFY